MTANLDDELTPEEAASFAALPRHAAMSDLAEQRTVDVLRARGLLQAHGNKSATRATVIAAGLAASLLLFSAGTVFGKQLAAREIDAASPSTQVQQAGTAYVNALVRLAGARDTERMPGLEAGAATLRAAAIRLSMIDPDDAVAKRIRSSLNLDSSMPAAHSVIWF